MCGVSCASVYWTLPHTTGRQLSLSSYCTNMHAPEVTTEDVEHGQDELVNIELSHQGAGKNDIIDHGIPELPSSKSYHLLFCYSSFVETEVRSIVADVEQYGLRCCFYERDFVTGKTIVKNIADLMEQSQGVVFIMTKEYLDSRYFPIEVEHYLELSESRKLNHMIPVRIDRCKIPMQLKHLTCIDLSERSFTETAKEVFAAFIKLAKEGKGEQDRIRIGGDHVSQSLESVRPWLSSSKYVLNIGEQFRADLRAKHIEVPDKALETAEKIVNSSVLVAHRKSMAARQLGLWVVGNLLIVSLLFCFGQAGSGIRTVFPGLHFSYYVLIGYNVVLIVLVVLALCFGWSKMLAEKAQNSVRRDLWHGINKALLYSHKTILLFEDDKLTAFRLNILPCKETFQRKVRTNPTFYNYDEQRESEEEFTNRMFADWLEKKYFVLLQVIPNKASTHSMTNGATCPCTWVNEYAIASLPVQGLSVSM